MVSPRLRVLGITGVRIEKPLTSCAELGQREQYATGIRNATSRLGHGIHHQHAIARGHGPRFPHPRERDDGGLASFKQAKAGVFRP